MQKQINKAVIPAGLIRRAKTYSLILKDKKIYIIYTGPAGNTVVTNNFLETVAVNKVYNYIDKKVLAGEQRLKELGVEQLAFEKGNTILSPTDVQSCAITLNYQKQPKLQLITTKGKFNFVCRVNTKEEIEEFTKQFLGK